MKSKLSYSILIIIVSVIFLQVNSGCVKEEDGDKDKLTDVDGNVYKTVIIGTQTWMAENLKTTKFNDGTAIPNVDSATEWTKLSSAAYCNYDNNEYNATTYGRLYNWHAVNTAKLAPTGWHVPTSEDWALLDQYLTDNNYRYDESADPWNFVLALASTTDWLPVDIGLVGTVGGTDYPKKRNSTGFSALPAGERTSGKYTGLYYSCTWWIPKEYSADQNKALTYGLGSGLNFRTSKYLDKSSGFSIRCVKD